MSPHDDTANANPYSPPRARESTCYFTTEPCNASLRELLRMAPPTLGGKFLAILVKCLRLKSPPQIGFALKSLVRREFSESPELIARFQSEIEQFEQQGYRPALSFSIPVLGNGFGRSLAMISQDSLSFALLVHTEMAVNDVPEVETAIAILSRSADEVFPTSNTREKLRSPPHFHTRVFPGFAPKELYAAHRDRLRELSHSRLQRFDTETLWATLKMHEDESTEFHSRRGVFRPMTMEEVAALEQSLAADASRQRPGQHDETSTA